MNTLQQGDRFFRRFVTGSSWPNYRFDAVFCRRKAVNSPDAQLLSVFLQKGVVPRSEGDGNNNRPGEDLSKYLVVRQGDFVFNKLRTWQGGFGLSNYDGIVSPAYYVCKPLIDLNGRFIDYLLHSHIYLAELTRISKWMPPSQFDIGWEDLRLLPVVLPAENVQKKIVDYLDCETTEADALVSNYEKLVELLEEKRLALITHTVTKGLNPKATLKDSGVEWFGEIPRHWDALRLKNLLGLVTSGSRGWAEHYADEGDLFIRIGNLTRNGIDLDLDEPRFVQPPLGSEGERTLASEGDLLVSITADLGSVAVMPHVGKSAYVSQHVALCRPKHKSTTSRWLAYAIFSQPSKTQLQQAAYGGTKIQLSLDDVKNIVIPTPPEDDRVHIATYLDQEVGKFDALIRRAMAAILLIKEHRSSLVTAAVTGQIDVRTYKKNHVEVPA